MTPDVDTPPAASDPAHIAHEIRNALAPLVNSLRVVRLVAGDDPRLESALEVIDRQTERLRRLADEITRR